MHEQIQYNKRCSMFSSELSCCCWKMVIRLEHNHSTRGQYSAAAVTAVQITFHILAQMKGMSTAQEDNDSVRTTFPILERTKPYYPNYPL